VSVENETKLTDVTQASPAALAGTEPELRDFFISDAERHSREAGELQAAARPPEKALDVLAFLAGDEEYGIAIAYVAEIVKVPPITAVPRVPPAVLGITSLRGTIVPVLDLRVVLGVSRPAVQRTSRLVVLRGDGQPLAMLVDQVSQVVRLDRASIEPRPEGVISRSNRYIECIARVNGRILVVLEPVAVLGSLQVDAR
jgi:purine-binding chemotaxis protein CheW